jgi:outer membrane immunogenic protein
MRRTILLIAGLVAAPAMASAASPTPYVAAAYNWTGFYLGAQVGYGWANDTTTNNTGSTSVPPGFTSSSTTDGILGGFYGGYNYQVSQYLFGIDGDFNWSDANSTSIDVGPLNGHIITDHHQMDWVTSVTGRLGYVSNNWLLFAKGGWAWAKFVSSATNGLVVGGPVGGFSSASTIRDGWTVGVGMEYGVTSNVSFKLEYDYVGFLTSNFTSTDQTVATGAIAMPSKSADSHLNVVKAGVAVHL